MSTPVRRFGTVTIAAAGSLSDAYDIGTNERLVGIILPAITSAAITLAAANPGTNSPQYTFGGPNGSTEFRDSLTYVPVHQASGAATAEWTTTASTGSTYIAIDPNLLAGLQYVKVRSGTNAAAVVQPAAVNITLVTVTI